jgi:hypothetical protein
LGTSEHRGDSLFLVAGTPVPCLFLSLLAHLLRDLLLVRTALIPGCERPPAMLRVDTRSPGKLADDL